MLRYARNDEMCHCEAGGRGNPLVFCFSCLFNKISGIFSIVSVQIVTVRVDTRLVAAVLFVKLFYQEPAALWAVLVDWFKVADKITLWIICTAVERLTASLCFAFYNITLVL